MRVLRRQFGQFLVRTIMQPLLFVFVFAYVFPKIGQGFSGHDESPANFTTVLVPGLIAVAINFQGIQAVALPLVQEFSVSKEIEDRVLAPVPVWVVGLEKIVAGAMQSLLAAGRRLPDRLPRARARRRAARARERLRRSSSSRSSFASLLASAVGLLIGTVLDPRKITLLFASIVIPITFLGCVYYPWASAVADPLAEVLRALEPAGLHVAKGCARR